MLTKVIRLGLVLALLAPAWAQDAPEKKDEKEKKESKKEASVDPKKKDDKEEKKDGGVVKGKKDKVRVLKPQDVPAELLRLKSKADIKAEVTILPLHGRKVTVKGVIRNGKLIERFIGRRFVAQKSLEHAHAGVRLWWVNGSAGWIFLRYSQVRSIKLTGQLTPEERREILRRLRAKKEGDTAKKGEDEAKAMEKIEEELEKMSQSDLESFLLRNYPADKGWSHKKLRELKRKQITDQKWKPSREEAIFMRYFNVLIKARLAELKRKTEKIEFEPGSEDKKDSDGGDAEKEKKDS